MLTRIGYRLRGEKPPVSEEPPKPVLNSAVIHTARLQMVDWVLRGLFDIKFVPGKQGKFIGSSDDTPYDTCVGTSAVENFNNFVANFLPRSQGQAKLSTIRITKHRCFSL